MSRGLFVLYFRWGRGCETLLCIISLSPMVVLHFLLLVLAYKNILSILKGVYKNTGNLGLWNHQQEPVLPINLLLPLYSAICSGLLLLKSMTTSLSNFFAFTIFWIFSATSKLLSTRCCYRIRGDHLMP